MISKYGRYLTVSSGIATAITGGYRYQLVLPAVIQNVRSGINNIVIFDIYDATKNAVEMPKEATFHNTINRVFTIRQGLRTLLNEDVTEHYAGAGNGVVYGSTLDIDVLNSYGASFNEFALLSFNFSISMSVEIDNNLRVYNYK